MSEQVFVQPFEERDALETWILTDHDPCSARVRWDLTYQVRHRGQPSSEQIGGHNRSDAEKDRR